METIYAQLKAAGVPLDHHESDLYAKVTPNSNRIVGGYEHKANVTQFTSQTDNAQWFDIPFAYDPFWEDKTGPDAYVPHPLQWPNVHRFDELFESWTFDKKDAPGSVPFTPHITNSQIGSYMSTTGQGRYSGLYVKAQPDTIKAVNKHAQIIGVENDESHWHACFRDDGTALITWNWNTIIGSVWLAIVDGRSVPTPPEEDDN